MRPNAVPAALAFAPALLLPLVQSVARPRVAHAGAVGAVLAWAPDFIVGFCFPFGILVRPRAWTARTAGRLFLAWAALTAVALVAVELLAPFGPNVRDGRDVAAALGGVALALALFEAVLRRRLTYGDGPAAA